jgi:hypothetical protein
MVLAAEKADNPPETGTAQLEDLEDLEEPEDDPLE